LASVSSIVTEDRKCQAVSILKITVFFEVGWREITRPTRIHGGNLSLWVYVGIREGGLSDQLRASVWVMRRSISRG
jgi:hypothetical protein